MLYRHLKTGKVYRLLAFGTDCTNARSGTTVAIYCPDDNEHTIYVRELDEFEARFLPISPESAA
ncbi:MAG: hypothetical protein ROZ37_01535 [Aromatoleum sp.]|jgi:hypothetical protein|uniref:hypothetical protein n=1 Tax=Aromatoleum sp. TaxID=2307007 RepID=UPI002895B1E2|nr:hypothetical protein [Aromatoleum sp.]MDT3668996.1 hypothetical protein [Aromatoleum sp.]